MNTQNPPIESDQNPATGAMLMIMSVVKDLVTNVYDEYELEDQQTHIDKLIALGEQLHSRFGHCYAVDFIDCALESIYEDGHGL